MAIFQDLTTELVELIAAYMDAGTLGSFRLTCRECYDRSFPDFVRRVQELKFLVRRRRPTGAVLSSYSGRVLTSTPFVM